MAVTKKHLAGVPPRSHVKRPASDTTCAVEGCERPRIPRKGMCRMHRGRIIRGGFPGMPAAHPRLSIEERLIRNSVDDGTGCRIWTGALNNMGYGATTLSAAGVRRSVYVHRLAYETFVGPIPPGMEILHACDRPACIEPTHLRPGTRKENAQEVSERQRHPRYLTPSQVAEIFERTDRGESIAAISRATGIPAGTISARRSKRNQEHAR